MSAGSSSVAALLIGSLATSPPPARSSEPLARVPAADQEAEPPAGSPPTAEPPPPADTPPTAEPPPPADMPPTAEPPPPADTPPTAEPPPPADTPPTAEPPPPADTPPTAEPPPPAGTPPTAEPPPPAGTPPGERAPADPEAEGAPSEEPVVVVQADRAPPTAEPELLLPPLPASAAVPPRPVDPARRLLLGGGTAALILAAGLGVGAGVAANELRQAEQRHDGDDEDRFRTVTWALAGPAMAYALTGIVLVALGAKRPKTTVAPTMARRSMGLSLTHRF